MSYGKIRHRLHEGRPLVVDSDVAASLGARGLELDEPGALGAVLYREPARVREHHLVELSCRVDVLSALTSDTTPRALAESGMEHRSARLTGKAIDLVCQLAEESARPVAVAGVLGSHQVSATVQNRFEAEAREHVARIAHAGAEIIIVRGMGSRLDLVFSVAEAAKHDIPTWAVVDPYIDGDFTDLAQSLVDAGAEAVLFEVSSVDEGLEKLRGLSEMGLPIIPGALLSAAPDALRGFPSPLLSSWVDRVVELTDAGARIVGGGAGTTEAHTRALVTRLGVIHPSIPPKSTN